MMPFVFPFFPLRHAHKSQITLSGSIRSLKTIPEFCSAEVSNKCENYPLRAICVKNYTETGMLFNKGCQLLGGQCSPKFI